MKYIRTILAALLLCAPAQAQTLKSLMFNSTNGQVVANRTNTLRFNVESSNGGVGFYDVADQQYSLLFPSDDIVQLLELRWNHPSVRTSLGLGATNDVVFNQATFSGPVTFNEDVFGSLFEAASGSNSVTLRSQGIEFFGTSAATTRTNLGLGATNAVSFRVVELTEEGSAGATAFNEGGNFVIEHQEGRIGEFSDQLSDFNTTIQTRGNLVVSQQSASTNGLLYIYRTNAEPFLGLANLIASNNVTVSNETLFRVGVAEATNRSAQFGFRSTNTNGNGVAVFSVFGYNALMMIGPSDPAAGTNPIQATVYSINPTNKVMTLITTNTGAMQMHRPIGIDTAGVSTNAPANTTNVAGWIQFYVGTNSVRVPYYQ